MGAMIQIGSPRYTKWSVLNETNQTTNKLISKGGCMKIKEKLRDRILDDPRFDDFNFFGSECERLYPSLDDRSAGAWSWCIVSSGLTTVGSQWSMKECLKANSWELHPTYLAPGQIAIWPIFKDNK